MEENAALNGMTTEDVIHPCQMLKLWSIPEYEGGANNPNCYDEPLWPQENPAKDKDYELENW
tara:strand:- start:477 stop:662 length:186 start_codon:yes stop_codon:yes gene_type:complete